MFEAPKVETNTSALRFSKQQRAVLQWMLEQEPLGTTLMEAEPDERQTYEPRLIPWSSRDFLNERPTSNQSSALSRTLSSLENRNLVTLHRGGGKKPRTTHVQFTREGRLYAEALQQGLSITLTKETGPSWTSTDSRRKTMLELSIIVFRNELERVKAAIDDNPSDYRAFDFPKIPSGKAQTLADVVEYQYRTEQSLRTAQELNREGSRKFIEILQNLINEGLLFQREREVSN